MKWFDRWTERSTRNVAQKTSRRSFLTLVGGALVGTAAVPLLPVARGDTNNTLPDESAMEGDQGNPQSCNYWRHCAIDGFPCSCCGGTQTSCPPGTELAPVTWIGTCRNPIDDKNYIISYNDCCGKSSCGRCLCNRNEGDKPIYMPQKANDINWCQGVKSNVYHCTIAAAVGVSTESQ